MEPDVMNGQRPPYINILPDDRQFVVVVSSSECAKNFCDLNVCCLDFNEVSPVIEYNGRLFIAAANEDTMEWVARNNAKVFSAFRGRNYHNKLPDLWKYVYVWRLLTIYIIRFYIRGQRSNLVCIEFSSSWNCRTLDTTTEKWAVMSRENAPPIVTDICPNEQVEIWMDANSVDIIKERCNRLKLSFWIEFEFCD
ncbi:uncharacterized protein Dwil_GK26902 [Drosophila willistoni]|uniref:Uncharacterized protein n=1 Tax=Drosophila willistoni TaxID=7260 RepID=A0A0Q9X5L0_DROWI|nr:uncharacterized protein Dwil_GK26902 [Drosophila willistoni]